MKDFIELYSRIAENFKIGGTVKEFKALGNGLINDTFLVTASNGVRYVLQSLNRTVFTDIDAVQNNLDLISRHIRHCLREAGEKDIDRKALIPVPTINDRLWLEDEQGKAWRMTRYIEGSVTREELTPEMAEVVGKTFARFHSYFARPDAPALQETIPDFHNVVFRIQQLRDAVNADKAHRLEECSAEVNMLLGRSEEMSLASRLIEEGLLPRRTAHCDTKLNNILFDEEGNTLCVIDLDTTMPGLVLSDFGDFIRTAANTGKEDDQNLDHVNVDMEIFRRFATGYVSNADFLTPTEKKLLPYGAQMLTYMQAVRFLTDYLDGDLYYKIQYPEHNLVRTRAQIKLLQSIDSNINQMNSHIESL